MYVKAAAVEQAVDLPNDKYSKVLVSVEWKGVGQLNEAVVLCRYIHKFTSAVVRNGALHGLPVSIRATTH